MALFPNRHADSVESVTTPATQWSNAWTMPLGHTIGPAVDVLAVLEIDVIEGEIGVSIMDAGAGIIVSRETRLHAGDGQIVEIVSQDLKVAAIACIRNVRAGERASVFRVRRCEAFWRKTYDISADVDHLLPSLLKSPGKESKKAIAAVLSRAGELVNWREIGELTVGQRRLRLSFADLWRSDDEQTIFASSSRLIDAVDRFSPAALGSNLVAPKSREYVRSYLKQNVTRIAHLVSRLRDMGMNRGRILEVGGGFGSFAYALAELGFTVTVVDRYADFNDALEPFLDLMRAANVEIVATSRQNEQEMIARLGEFDAVVSMAVVEHIPHTPRPFLAVLASHIRPGGILAIDTPNIARYWNRRQLNEGLSVHQDIEIQFNSAIPFEGHHREYTSDELSWMLAQVGLTDIASERFDYNLFQFDVIEGEHIDALLAIACDDSLADTILCVGRKAAL